MIPDPMLVGIVLGALLLAAQPFLWLFRRWMRTWQRFRPHALVSLWPDGPSLKGYPWNGSCRCGWTAHSDTKKDVRAAYGEHKANASAAS
jgi:hypothetical protein